jgi:hypothetical protein
MNKHINKVIMVLLPNVKKPRWRWIVKKRDDGRYIVKIPKNDVLLRDLNKKRNKDFGNETLLPIGSKVYNRL